MKKQTSQNKIQQDGIITTVYFDGQFYCALIEKYCNNDYFVGRHVFGKEPSNPEFTNWMVNEFAFVPLLKENIQNAPRGFLNY